MIPWGAGSSATPGGGVRHRWNGDPESRTQNSATLSVLMRERRSLGFDERAMVALGVRVCAEAAFSSGDSLSIPWSSGWSSFGAGAGLGPATPRRCQGIPARSHSSR